MRRTRSMNGSGYKIVAFARPTYGAIEPMEEIAISAKLTVQGTNVNVRTSPNTNASIEKKLNAGAEIQATGRVLIQQHLTANTGLWRIIRPKMPIRDSGYVLSY